MPQDGRPGRVNVEEYFKIDDPREAARLLLEEAELAGLDVDRMVTTKPYDSILLGSGEFTPDPADRQMVEKAAAALSTDGAEHEFICLIKLNRYLSIREIATLMESGVHLYRGVPYYTYIARVNAATFPALQKMETVVWIGELTPERKYPQDKPFDATRPIHVYSLVGDTAECRADLESLGATILIASRTSRVGHEWELYVVTIDPAQIAVLTRLWWVHYVRQPAAAVPKVSSASEGSDREIIPSAPAVGELKPLDSRRLVSAVADGQFEGAGQTVLIYEFGLDWEHPDLHANLIEDIRFPATNDPGGLHGAMVAGIAVGRRNTNVLNGGVSGIAPRAKFRFVST